MQLKWQIVGCFIAFAFKYKAFQTLPEVGDNKKKHNGYGGKYKRHCEYRWYFTAQYSPRCEHDTRQYSGVLHFGYCIPGSAL